MIEVFHNPKHYALEAPSWERDGEHYPHGWYYWHVQPGCLPDTDPVGPFDSEEDATKAAEEEESEDDHV